MSILRKIIPAVLAVVFMFAVPGAAQAGRVEVKDGWFYVDGEKFFVKGVGYFEAHDISGKYEQNPPEVLDHEFKRIKEAGFNTIRTYLTPEKIEIARKYGLMIMQDADRLCFSDEYKDPAKMDELRANIDRIVDFSKKYDNILFYTIDNEPNVKAMYRQGEGSAADMWKMLSEKVKQVRPVALTSICIMPPDAIADISMCDVASLNLYPFNPANNSIGYTAYADWYRRARAKDKPFIISEYGWTDDLKELGPAMMGLLDQQIKAGAVGSFFFTWRAWGKEKEKDNQWWGIIPENGGPDDYKNQPRPVYFDFQRYFEAVVIEPKQDGIYSRNLRFEIYGSDRIVSVTVSCGNRKAALKKQGRYWWIGNIMFGPSSYGNNTAIIEAKGRDGKVLARKEVKVHLCGEKKSLSVKILRENKILVKGGSYEAKVIVVDGKGGRVPNQPLHLGINQSGADEWASLPRKGTTGPNGEYSFKEEGIVPGYFTLMAGADTKGNGTELSADVDIVRIEDLSQKTP